MGNQHQYYYINKIETKTPVPNTDITLVPGYYRIKFGLSATDNIENQAQYSSDRVKWENCSYLYNNLSDFTKLFKDIKVDMTIERMEYAETITYRGYSIPIFLDDYGQCFYCIFNNKVIAFGSFTCDYELDVKDLVDIEIEHSVKQNQR